MAAQDLSDILVSAGINTGAANDIEKKVLQASTDANGNVTGIVDHKSGNAVYISGADVTSKASSIQTKSICAFPVQSSAHGVNRNTHLQLTTEAHFDQVRLILINGQAVTQTGIQASIGVSASPIVDIAGMNSFVPDAFINVTWATANNVTQSAGIGLKDVAYSVSDWMDLSSVNQSSGNFPFVHIRIFQPSTNTNITNYGATPNLAWMNTASDGRVLNYWYKDTTDLSQNMPAFSSGAAVAPRIVPFILQYKSRGRIRTLGIFGDSLAFGQGGTNYGYGYARMIHNQLSTTSRPVEIANLGMPGATTTEFYNNLQKLITAGVVPHWSIYHAGSPNDISTTITAPLVSTMRTQLNKAIDSLLSAGSIPFIATWCPSNSASKNYGATDSLRVSYNSQITNMTGVNTLDIANAVSGITTGGQVQINTSMSNADNLHINDAGALAQFNSTIAKFTLAS